MSEIRLYYLVKGRAVSLRAKDGIERTFAPSSLIPEKYAADLLTKQVTVGGCCGKPEKTSHLFATEEQLSSGDRSWIG